MTAVRRSVWSGFALAGALWCASCAWIPKGDPPAEYIEPPEMKETLAEVTHRLQQWPDDRWWEQFGNPELNDLIETALKDNPGLKVASARLREATAMVKVEGAIGGRFGFSAGAAAWPGSAVASAGAGLAASVFCCLRKDRARSDTVVWNATVATCCSISTMCVQPWRPPSRDRTSRVKPCPMRTPTRRWKFGRMSGQIWNGL